MFPATALSLYSMLPFMQQCQLLTWPMPEHINTYMPFLLLPLRWHLYRSCVSLGSCSTGCFQVAGFACGCRIDFAGGIGVMRQ